MEVRALEPGERPGSGWKLPRWSRRGRPYPYELAEICFEDLAKREKWHEPLHVYIDDEDFGPAEDWGATNRSGHRDSHKPKFGTAMSLRSKCMNSQLATVPYYRRMVPDSDIEP